MYPLKRESPSHTVTPPVNLVLINPKKNKYVDEDNRRLIARVAPVCLAYKLHLWLVDFGINETPIEFARGIAPSTSIGEGGENLIKLCEKGRVNISKLELPQNIRRRIICTSQPDASKQKKLDDIIKISKEKTISLIFGISRRTNKILKNIRDESFAHLDITNKRIQLSLDSEIGAVCHSFFDSRKA